ncbi:hypothetical protein SDC9_135382 [bioreactor metagenome]|uniref:Uncharacterized protein n=1 Tax=bioreactor metagenome TaxID=1076179 RepID=A0A645DFM1_9ZZZZ
MHRARLNPAPLVMVHVAHIGPLGNHRGNHRKHRGLVVPVPLEDALHRDGNKHANDQRKNKRKQHEHHAHSPHTPGKAHKTETPFPFYAPTPPERLPASLVSLSYHFGFKMAIPPPKTDRVRFRLRRENAPKKNLPFILS